MKTVTIQDLEIPSIALGTWAWGVGGGAGGDAIFGHQLDENALKPVFDKAMEEGLTLFDTATAYANGASESILGSFVKDNPKAQVSTKFTVQVAQAQNLSEENAVETLLDASRERLNKEIIDIYWIHNSQGIETWTPKLIPLLKSGKVKKVGVSNHNLNEIKRVQEIFKAEGFQLHAIQNHYSLLYTTIEDTGILDYCRQEGIAVFAYMILEQGALGGKYSVENPLPANTRRGQAFPPETLAKLEPLFEKLRELAANYNVSVAQIVTAHCIGKAMIPIIGVSTVEQVEDAAKAANITLSEEEISLLDQVARETGVSVKGAWEVSM